MDRYDKVIRIMDRARNGKDLIDHDKWILQRVVCGDKLTPQEEADFRTLWLQYKDKTREQAEREAYERDFTAYE